MTINQDKTLRLQCGKTILPRIRVVLSRPLFEEDHYASILSADNQKELAIVHNLKALSKKSREALEYSKLRRYLTSKILRVRSLAHQFGSVYWDVDTNKGRREFVIRGVSEHVRWLSYSHLLITDVDGNRFEIEDQYALDRKSQSLVDLIL